MSAWAPLFARHPREGGDPGGAHPAFPRHLDSRFRGDDGGYYPERRSRARGLFFALLALIVVAFPALAGDSRPVLPKAKGDKCVESVDVMRRNHFNFLTHQRDQTLRQGIRGAKYSLKDCVECHSTQGADGKAVPVNAPGQFCQSCHDYAAVSIDCFSCHATTPGPLKEANAK